MARTQILRPPHPEAITSLVLYISVGSIATDLVWLGFILHEIGEQPVPDIVIKKVRTPQDSTAVRNSRMNELTLQLEEPFLFASLLTQH